MYQIEELPDLKVAWHESYKCLAEPLLEYVWEVANHFLPDYAETDMGMIPVESSRYSCLIATDVIIKLTILADFDGINIIFITTQSNVLFPDGLSKPVRHFPIHQSILNGRG